MGKLNKTLAYFQDGSRPAHGLPPSAYRSKAFWKKERKTVLFRNWVCVAAAHELKFPGDVVPVVLAEQPLILVRNRQNEIAAFHNVCRHRCMMLVEKPQNVGKLIRCPYHAWAYDLDGRLKASPHFGGTDTHETNGFDKSQNGLVPVRTRVWQDWVFVNLSGDAPDFEDYAASLIARLEGIDFCKLTHIGTLDFGVIDTNWKLIMENFIEPYHVQFVHSSTTDQPLKDHYTIVDGNCLGSAVDLAEESGTSGSLGVSSRYLTLYPNFILGRYFPDQMGVYLNIPIGPNQMMQKRYLYTTEGQNLSEDEVDSLKNLWWDVHKEDHEMVERMWRGRASDFAADGGVLSPVWEDSVRAFQEMIVADVTKSKGA
ncbi:aromatic ring-hydroxylating oxygenase subunit alpha [Ruegeria arenilitoris]|uniref:aromatic ring-hydroxylating oxygenase subunit alpha n=1 Tax=Ruegeria arenilitoris TaxID=1173585 RepID=UPI00147B6327|nr:aromatic ring-hydroxylating dioxygenase subunit alpha [Ruegeria arenilitoris]